MNWYTNLASAHAVDRNYDEAFRTLNTMKGRNGTITFSVFPTLIRTLGIAPPPFFFIFYFYFSYHASLYTNLASAHAADHNYYKHCAPLFFLKQFVYLISRELKGRFGVVPDGIL
jgi:hypothetical protein